MTYKVPLHTQYTGFVFPPEWSIQDIYIQGEYAGFWAVKDNEIHCWRNPKFQGCWLTRQKIEDLVKPLLSKYGSITTKVRLNNEQGHTFIRRLGFTETKRDNECVYYETERLNHARL